MKRMHLTGGAYAVIVIVLIFYIALLVTFGCQTWFLVDWLFPSSNLFMKIGTLFSFDIMAAVWALATMLYVFHNKITKWTCEGMWGISFLLATAASVLQMYMASTERLNFLLSPDAVRFAYGLVIISITLQLLSLTVCFRLEWHAIFGTNVVEYREAAKNSTPVQVTPATPSVQNQPVPARIPSASSQGGVPARPLAQRTPYRAPQSLNNGNTEKPVEQ